MIKKFYIGLVLIALGSFLLGWLFPVEGPIDYVYDDYKVKKSAGKICPLQESKAPVIFNEEELDYLNELMEEMEEMKG